MTEIWAHRGASGYAPENTLEAFELAAKMNADGVELDVQLTKDGELVVIHDETINRVSEQTGWVKNFNLKELQEINVNQTVPSYAKVKIPTLKEVYELLMPTNLKINVELKTGIFFYPGIEAMVLKLTKEMKMEDRVWYSSFNHYTIKAIKEIDLRARTGILYADGIYEPWNYAKQIGADALHPAMYNTQYPDFFEECKKNNLKTHIWTVNDKEYVEKMIREGADAVITNYPDIALKTREEEHCI